jgi:hypothetical protein
MSDVRCPMCGKPNPAEAEICKFCQARLKPLNLDSASPAGNEPEVPNWLTSIRGSGQDQPESASQSEPVPDWLTGLRSESSSEGDEEAGAEQADYSGVTANTDRQVPDWLKGILPEEETTSSPASLPKTEPESFEESEQDWSLRFNQAPSEPPPYEPVPLPDWLSDFDQPAASLESPAVDKGAIQPPAEEVPPIEPPQDEPTDLPGWLSGFDRSTATPEPPPAEQQAAGLAAEASAPEASLPDWMSGAKPLASGWQTPSQIPSAPPAPPAQTQTPVEHEYDFLEEIPEEPHQEFADEEISFPDWLKGISQETNTPLVEGLEEQPPAVSQSPSAGLAEAPGSGQPESEAVQAAELPDWLAAAEQSLQADGDQSGLPDWLGQAGYPSQAGSSYIGEETPSWLPPRSESEAPSSGSVAPFQFTDMEGEPDLTDAVESAAAFSAGQSQPDQTTSSDLSWLDEMEASLPGMALASDQAARSDHFAPAVEPQPAAPAGAPPPTSPLPDWLTQPTAQEQPGEQEGAPEADESGLAPVELPAWLKSMQPTATMDAQAKEKAEKDQLEGSGPLIGLKGILPAEPDIVQVTKPPTYSQKLRVTDLQQAHAAMLAELVQAEGDVKPIPSAPLFTSQGLQRILIAVVLIGVILISMAAGIPQLIEPSLDQYPDVFTASQFIARLPAGVPVLVAVDYSPGYSGDVGLLLASIIDHLATKGESIALVTTVPTGPLQVESLVAQLKARPGFTVPENYFKENYFNLGFIPGGSTGILTFIQEPSGTLPSSAWTAGGLQNIHSLADFTLLVVATENPETARMWIEQVRPLFPKIPLVMALSTQAEPLVRPYYNASPQQIQGLVSGYSAALVYDTALGRRTVTASLWSPFAAGLTAALLLMVIGLLVNLLLGFLARNKEKARSGEKA